MPLLALPALHAQTLPQGARGRIVFWCGVLLGTALVLIAAAVIIRRHLAGQEGDTAGPPMGFTLADLREMHASGQLSDEEFDYAKRKMVAKTRASIAEEDDDDDGDGPGPGLDLDTPPDTPPPDLDVRSEPDP